MTAADATCSTPHCGRPAPRETLVCKNCFESLPQKYRLVLLKAIHGGDTDKIHDAVSAVRAHLWLRHNS